MIAGILADLEAGFRAAIAISMLIFGGVVMLSIAVVVLQRMFRS